MQERELVRILKRFRKYENLLSFFFGILALAALGWVILGYIPKVSKQVPLNIGETETITATPTALPAAKTHSTVSTDTLWKLAQQYYNDGNKWTIIYEANKAKITNPDALEAGITLQIP